MPSTPSFPSEHRPRVSHAVAIFVLSALFVAFLGLDGLEARGGGDADYYLAMTADPGTFSQAPWGFRIGTPFLAYLLPLPPAQALWVVNTVFLALVAAVLFWLIAGIAGPSQAVFIVLLFMASPAAVKTAENPFLVDASYYLFLVVCLSVAYRSKWWWLAAALAASVVFKESVLLLVPSLLLIAVRSGTKRISWTQAGLVVLAPVAVYALLHWTPFVWGAIPVGYEYGSAENFEQVIDYIHRWGSIPKVFVSSFLHSWGALWVVFGFALFRSPEPVRLGASFALICVATMLVAADWPRMLYPAFVVVLPALAFTTIPWLPRLASVLLLALQTLIISRFDPSGLKYALEALVVLGILAAFGPELRRIALSYCPASTGGTP